MIFALDTRGGELDVFDSPDEVMKHCEKYDISEGEWAFFTDAGAPLVPIPEPRRAIFGMKIDESTYTFEESNIGDGPDLLSRLSEVRSIESGPFETLDALRMHLIESRANG